MMSDSFDVNAYWIERGRRYDAEPRLAGDYHKLQESFLVDVLRVGRVPMQRVLEIGCGFGRVTKVLAEAFPQATITAVDLSPDQLNKAARHCAGCDQVHFQPYDFYSSAPFPGQDYDAVIASEVFLHHPRDVVRDILQRLRAAARHLVNIDWCEDWRAPVSDHVWIHNYRALYAEAALACVGFALPQRVNGKQQRLFIATENLSDELVGLERLLGRYGPTSQEPRWVGQDGTPRANPPADWTEGVRRSEEELRSLIADGATFILADDGQWGNRDAFGTRRVLPFLERDGCYWGPPRDDEQAGGELDRLRAGGATHFVVAWPAFWWLDHYGWFAHRLRSTFPCVLENDRLLVFQLAS